MSTFAFTTEYEERLSQENEALKLRVLQVEREVERLRPTRNKNQERQGNGCMIYR
jgi:hypothetical protein